MKDCHHIVKIFKEHNNLLLIDFKMLFLEPDWTNEQLYYALAI